MIVLKCVRGEKERSCGAYRYLASWSPLGRFRQTESRLESCSAGSFGCSGCLVCDYAAVSRINTLTLHNVARYSIRRWVALSNRQERPLGMVPGGHHFVVLNVYQ